ncbi:hypothetical protein FOZ62_015113, partial [Perkinsus olseni]
VFTDASNELWGVDVRCIQADRLTQRLYAKGGLFPVPQLSWTIPRKELVALHRGLQLLKDLSNFLPVATSLRRGQAEPEPLTPDYPARPVLLLTDSEINIYRLRRPSNDRRLPIVERRRLADIRRLCRELDVVIRHVPSAANQADTISRGKLPDKSMTGAELLNCVKTSEVYYDYKSSPDPEDEDTTPRLGSSDSAKESVNMVNGDGINLPDLTGVTTEEVGELTQLLEYAKPNDQIRGGLLEGSLLQECINVC